MRKEELKKYIIHKKLCQKDVLSENLYSGKIF